MGDRYSRMDKRRMLSERQNGRKRKARKKETENEKRRKGEVEVYYTLYRKGRRQGNGYHFRVVFCSASRPKTRRRSRRLPAARERASGLRRFLMFRSRCMAKHSFPYKPICFKCKAASAHTGESGGRKDEVGKRGARREGGGEERQEGG